MASKLSHLCQWVSNESRDSRKVWPALYTPSDVERQQRWPVPSRSCQQRLSIGHYRTGQYWSCEQVSNRAGAWHGDQGHPTHHREGAVLLLISTAATGVGHVHDVTQPSRLACPHYSLVLFNGPSGAAMFYGLCILLPFHSFVISSSKSKSNGCKSDNSRNSNRNSGCKGTSSQPPPPSAAAAAVVVAAALSQVV